MPRDYGCGDNSCLFGPPGGMATNGGCRCLTNAKWDIGENRRRVQRGILRIMDKNRRLRAVAEAARDFMDEVVCIEGNQTLEDLEHALTALETLDEQ
jgi:hypothetical protein